MNEKELVLDAKNGIVGRIASFAAKQALFGKTIIIVNCNEAILTGRRNSIVSEYNSIRRRGGSSLNGPFFPKSPERLVKRTIRGMLAYTQRRGKDALKRIMCYNQVPKEYESAKKIVFIKETKAKTINLAELEKVI